MEIAERVSLPLLQLLLVGHCQHSQNMVGSTWLEAGTLARPRSQVPTPKDTVKSKKGRGRAVLLRVRLERVIACRGEVRDKEEGSWVTGLEFPFSSSRRWSVMSWKERKMPCRRRHGLLVR